MPPRGTARGRRETNWGPRLLAPAAFLAAATVAVLLIRAGMEPNGNSTSAQPPTTTRSAGTTRPTTTQRRPTVRRTYVIREGDTFETIAFEQGTTVERLQALNPDVDPNSLQVGQRIFVPR